MVLSQLPST